jgi:2,5-diamino-6-(ribosylamino)-4(3H)-pyrimidinone 5'-phosphate reductase
LSCSALPHTDAPVKSHNVQRPFVFVNMAITADGKIATANRSVSSFGSAKDHLHLLELRSRADAVMAGARTVDLNPVNLGPGPARFRRQRLRNGRAEYNLRIIVSRSGSVNLNAEIFKHRFSPILILTTGQAGRRRLESLKTVADEVKICGAIEIDFAKTLRWLRQKWGVRNLLCEGGGELNDALFREGLVDELHLTLCPKVFGGRHAPTIADGMGRSRLAQAASFQLKSVRRIGNEFFLTFHNRA